MLTIIKTLKTWLTPASAARSDRPALGAFARHVRVIASQRAVAPSFADTRPGVFGLLVETHRNDR